MRFPLLSPKIPLSVILDLVCRSGSGFEVIGEIRKQSWVPIIVLSARGDKQSKVKALDLGADDYIGKPFGMAELMARLRAALRHQFPGSGRVTGFVSGGLRSIWPAGTSAAPARR